MAKRKTFESALFSFAHFANYDKAIDFLATKLADPETWEFHDSVRNHNSILKSYLEHIFRKLKAENKIAVTPNNGYACFNTGLTTRNLEEIYAFFEKSNIPHTLIKSPSPFHFKAFLKKSDYQLLSVFCDNLPLIADFFKKPEDLIFNPNCDLIPQIDHIIEDNLERFPTHMQTLDNHEIRRRLEGAIDEARRRVKTNYKIAVPQYYGNKIQLLLPLYLTPGSSFPDLALVLHKISSETYTARTCLTLKMAYNNARLIVKPQSSWLQP